MAEISAGCLRPWALAMSSPLIVYVFAVLPDRTIRWLPGVALAVRRRHKSAHASVRASNDVGHSGTDASCRATDYHGQPQMLLRGRRSQRNRGSHRARRMRVFPDGSATDELDRRLSCARGSGHQRLLHGRRLGFGACLSSPYCIAPRCFRPSRLGPRPDHWMGRYATSATANRKGKSDGDISDRGKNSRCRGIAHRPSGRYRGGPAGGNCATAVGWPARADFSLVSSCDSLAGFSSAFNGPFGQWGHSRNTITAVCASMLH